MSKLLIAMLLVFGMQGLQAASSWPVPSTKIKGFAGLSAVASFYPTAQWIRWRHNYNQLVNGPPIPGTTFNAEYMQRGIALAKKMHHCKEQVERYESPALLTPLVVNGLLGGSYVLICKFPEWKAKKKLAGKIAFLGVSAAAALYPAVGYFKARLDYNRLVTYSGGPNPHPTPIVRQYHSRMNDCATAILLSQVGVWSFFAISKLLAQEKTRDV